MLVLARQVNERLRLRVAGIEIWVSVADISGSRVRLGIEAPAEVEILREEVIPPEENQWAATT